MRILLILLLSGTILPIFAEPTIIPWDDFSYDLSERHGIFTNKMIPASILEAGEQYYVIQKVDFEQKDFANNTTQVNETVGYAFQLGDKMLRPPKGENVTDADHREFMKKVQEQQLEFPNQSSIGDSYEFKVDIKNRFYIKFQFTLEDQGQYTYQFYQHTDIFQGPTSGGMGGFVVVQKYSKALDEDGQCRKDNFTRVIKHDYSTVACTTVETFFELKERNWGIN